MHINFEISPYLSKLKDFKVHESEIEFKFKIAEDSDSIKEFRFAKKDLSNYYHEISIDHETITLIWKDKIVTRLTDTGDTLEAIIEDSEKPLIIDKNYFEVWKDGVWS